MWHQFCGLEHMLSLTVRGSRSGGQNLQGSGDAAAESEIYGRFARSQPIPTKRMRDSGRVNGLRTVCQSRRNSGELSKTRLTRAAVFPSYGILRPEQIEARASENPLSGSAAKEGMV